jgi:hypothetical protein
MNPHGDGKPEPADSDQAIRLLELELAQRRAALRNARSPYRAFRIASLFFLLAVIVGAALAFYFVFYSGGLDEMRARRESAPKSTSPAQTP